MDQKQTLQELNKIIQICHGIQAKAPDEVVTELWSTTGLSNSFIFGVTNRTRDAGDLINDAFQRTTKKREKIEREIELQKSSINNSTSESNDQIQSTTVDNLLNQQKENSTLQDVDCVILKVRKSNEVLNQDIGCIFHGEDKVLSKVLEQYSCVTNVRQNDSNVRKNMNLLFDRNYCSFEIECL